MRRIPLICVVFLLVVFSSVVFGETIYLRDGSVVTGDIIKTTADSIVVKTDYGDLTISKDKIERIEYEKPSVPTKPEHPKEKREKKETGEKYGVGFQAVGGRLGLVNPEDVDVTFGIGGHADLGTIVSTLHLFPSIEFWHGSESIKFYGIKIAESSYSEIAINGDVRYYFPYSGTVRIEPFVGGGLSLCISTASISYVDGNESSDTDVDIGLEFLGGVDFPLGTTLIGFVEGKFKIGGWDSFKLTGGITFPMGGD